MSEAAVAVRRRLGHVPAAREGSVVFVANLSHIFFDNEGLTERLRRTVEGLSSYGGRLLPVIGLLWRGPDNLLLLEREAAPALRGYFGETLALRLPETGRYDESAGAALAERIAAVPGRRMDGFVTDERLAALARAAGIELAGTVAGSRHGNDKRRLHHHLEGCGERVFPSVEIGSAAELPAAAAELARRGFRRAAVKTPVGASGIGLWRFECGAPPALPDCYFQDGPCLVQGWIDESMPGVERIASPSVQLLLGRRRIELFDTTDQILSEESVHEGNGSPPASLVDPRVREEVLRQAELAALWLHRQGYRGTASADFHLAFRVGGEVEVRVCELNARVTGATYPSLLARHFRPRGAWLMRNLRLPRALPAAEVLEDLAAADLLFEGSGSGVLPINFNQDESGLVTKGQFLVLGGDLEEVATTMRATVALREFAFTRD